MVYNVGIAMSFAPSPIHHYGWYKPTQPISFPSLFPAPPGGLLQKGRRLGARGGGARGARRGVFLGAGDVQRSSRGVDLMGFYAGLIGFYAGLMGFYAGLMGFYTGLMGFYNGLM